VLLPLLLLAGLLVLPGDAGAATTTVRLEDNQFNPAEVTIVVGDTITWLWTGSNQHSVRSEQGGFGSHDDCGPLLRQGNCGGPGSTFSHTFTGAGTFAVRCEVHGGQGMVSTVTVVAPGPSPTPTPEPSTPAPQPTPQPTPTANPEPTPAPPAVPDPIASAPTVAVPPPSPDVTPSPTATESPTTGLEFEPFVEEPDLPKPAPVVVAAPGPPSPLARGLGILVALGVLGLWAGMFGRMVLFGDPWEAPPAA